MARRRHSSIDKLPADVKETVDEMIKADFTYREIVEYLRDCGTPVSLSSVGRYAANLNAGLQAVRMAQENFRAIMEETDKYPNLDITDGLLRLLASQILEGINTLPEDAASGLGVERLIDKAIALTKAVAYKRNIDIKNKDILTNGADEFRRYLFDAMAEEAPKLYADVIRYVKSKEASI